MKEYKGLTEDQKNLFGELVGAIEKSEDIGNILKSDSIQDVLNTWIRIDKDGPGKGCCYTFLTYAIYKGNIKAAEDILNTTNLTVLQELLKQISKVLVWGNQYVISLGSLDAKVPVRSVQVQDSMTMEMTAWAYAAQGAEHFTTNVQCQEAEEYNKRAQEFEALAKKIEEKMDVISRTSNNLFWAVLWRDGKAAYNILESSKNQGDITQILQAGLMKTLLISDEKAQELSGRKSNESIINTIQKRQAAVIGISGAVLLAIGTLASVLANPLFFIATGIGLAGVIFAGYHGLKPVPDIQVEKVEQKAVDEEHVKAPAIG